MEKLFDDVRRELIAWNVLFPREQTLEQFAACPPAATLKHQLHDLLGSTWSETWWKTPPQKNRPHPQRVARRGHSSASRLIQAANAKKNDP